MSAQRQTTCKAAAETENQYAVPPQAGADHGRHVRHRPGAHGAPPGEQDIRRSHRPHDGASRSAPRQTRPRPPGHRAPRRDRPRLAARLDGPHHSDLPGRDGPVPERGSPARPAPRAPDHRHRHRHRRRPRCDDGRADDKLPRAAAHDAALPAAPARPRRRRPPRCPVLRHVGTGPRAAARCANYCASKAALRALVWQVRAQLRDEERQSGQDAVRVVEIVPPAVQTELHTRQGLAPIGMPLADFIDEMWVALESGEQDEILVGPAKEYAHIDDAKREAFQQLLEARRGQEDEA
ncbi:conserved hypothetical protein [Verticillium alfalfae VaMs.102]|uniref:Uncharacterized protein n=1 Tax=Verticillium alfalfae (strain VaMs.102 / ATCC MYA-4576 / FGSC 10136) TaxID=526221 RepID=C9S9D1_VERA1|nr:conserved hypothetical protein [Verticillium alfalfae VaMs.102]EEY15994.1 conserved hypothetical protein [Verticillium alfalfae VaMs.102]